jgi:hypothetical protein
LIFPDFFGPVNKKAIIGWKAAFIIHAAAAAPSFLSQKQPVVSEV